MCCSDRLMHLKGMKQLQLGLQLFYLPLDYPPISLMPEPSMHI